MGKTSISQDHHEELPQTTIYAIEIPPCWNHHNIYDLFSPYGAINSINIHTKPNSNLKYCYISYCSFTSVQNAFYRLNNRTFQIDNTPFKLELVNKHQGSTIAVKHIHESITDDQFHKAFRPYGTIIKFRIKRDGDGPIRGLISFNSYEEAACVISNMHGRMLLQRQLQVFFPKRPGQRRVSSGRLNYSTLALCDYQIQRFIIGEHLYLLIVRQQPILASKILRMLFEMDNDKLIHLLKYPEALSNKINETLAILEAH
jgi:RNA recognition motif-containing protein